MKPTKENALNVRTRILNPEKFEYSTKQQFLRFVGKWAHSRGYWPTADEMALAKYKKRSGEALSEREFHVMRRRVRDFACDLVMQGDLAIENPKICDLRLTPQGWARTPYEPIEPADNKRQAEQRKYGFRNRVHTIARLELAAEAVNKRLAELRAEASGEGVSREA